LRSARYASNEPLGDSMRKRAKSVKAKSSAKGTKAQLPAKRARPKSKARATPKASARRAISGSKSKLTNVAKKSAKAAMVAAALAAVDTAVGELNLGKKAPPERESPSGC
jgi:hypothetical protein